MLQCYIICERPLRRWLLLFYYLQSLIWSSRRALAHIYYVLKTRRRVSRLIILECFLEHILSHLWHLTDHFFSKSIVFNDFVNNIWGKYSKNQNRITLHIFVLFTSSTSLTVPSGAFVHEHAQQSTNPREVLEHAKARKPNQNKQLSNFCCDFAKIHG